MPRGSAVVRVPSQSVMLNPLLRKSRQKLTPWAPRGGPYVSPKCAVTHFMGKRSCKSAAGEGKKSHWDM